MNLLCREQSLPIEGPEMQPSIHSDVPRFRYTALYVRYQRWSGSLLDWEHLGTPVLTIKVMLTTSADFQSISFSTFWSHCLLIRVNSWNLALLAAFMKVPEVCATPCAIQWILKASGAFHEIPSVLVLQRKQWIHKYHKYMAVLTWRDFTSKVEKICPLNPKSLPDY